MNNEQILGAYNYIVARCKEPSSHTAIAYVVGSLGLQTNSPAIQSALFLVSLGFGVSGFFVKEGKPLTNDA